MWAFKPTIETLSKAKPTRGMGVHTKVTSLRHITSSYTNLDQVYHQILDQASTSKSKTNIRISTLIQLHNLNQT